MTTTIETSAPILNFEGKPITHADGKPATFRTLCMDVLLNRAPDDTPKSVMSCYRLAELIAKTDRLEVSPEAATFLRARALRCPLLTILAAGRLVDMLGGGSKS